MGTICAMAMVMGIAWVRGAEQQSPPASPGISSSSCRAVAGPAAGQLCTFPFTFAGSVRTSCIPDTDPEGRLWCSTKVDGEGRHVGGAGNWGYCPASGRCAATAGGEAAVSSALVAATSEAAGCVTAAGEAGRCVTPAACVGVDHANIDAATCLLGTGGRGLCCRDNLRNNIVQLPAAEDEDEAAVSRVGFPEVTAAELDTLFAEAAREVETGVINRRFHPGPSTGNQLPTEQGGAKKKTASFFHHKFNSPRKEIVNIDKEARKLVQVTRKLAELKNLTASQASTGLRAGFNLATSSRISQTCPWNNPVPVCSKNSKYRTVDGTCNNLRRPNYGRTGTPYQRILLPEYGRGSLDLPRRRRGGGGELPAARELSNQLASGANTGDTSNTVLLMQMGQFIDHDLTHTPNFSEEEECCGPGGQFPASFSSDKCFPLRLSRRDPFWRGAKTCMEFSRSLASPGLRCELQHREQTNQITHWLDGSNIYGSEEQEAANLRSSGGRLKVSRSSRQSRGELPTCTRAGAADMKACETCEGESADCFFAGDFRVNEQLNLVVVHTLFMREHNRVAAAFQRRHPGWSDEQLYQEARRVTVAEYQHIVYNEWLPAVLGNNFMRTFGLFPLSSGHSFDYDESFDPRINNEFAAAAFRFGHSLVPKTISMKSRNRRRVMNLKEVFFQPSEMKEPGFFDGLLRGLMEDRAKAADADFVDEIRNHLFEKSDRTGGLDLVALNIQRGRDHGLPGYNKYREICSGRRAATWADLRSSMLPEHVSALRRLYRHLDDIDLFVGGFLEQPHEDSLVGPVFKCIIGDQFARLKKGDRYFYDLGVDANTRFTQQELAEVRKASLARLICDNSEVEHVQPFVLKLPLSNANAIRSCSEQTIPSVDLNVFHSSDFGR